MLKIGINIKIVIVRMCRDIELILLRALSLPCLRVGLILAIYGVFRLFLRQFSGAVADIRFFAA